MSWRGLAALAVMLLAATRAAAGDDQVPPVTDPVVRKECGACHMTFQPAFLPARSWRRLVDGLADHFGEDASLPAAQAEIIRTWLAANAGDVAAPGEARKYMRSVTPDGAPLRITENPAFLRKHRFPESTWKDPKVMTRSNCLACHPAAEHGRYG
jgi:hypothetical protein